MDQIRKIAGAGFSRRGMLGGAAGLAAIGVPAAHAGRRTIASEWQVFRGRFLTPDGRVVDTGNHGISHSEGQGWGMLFAQAAGDKAGFDLIHGWTSTHLKRPDDALHFWRYDPGAAQPVSDPNNATDGDIFIAWALARAAQRWRQPTLSVAAANIARDILAKLCVAQSGKLFLLPGAAGFSASANFILNPSYYIFPAFDTLAKLAPSAQWDRLRADGLDLLQRGLFGAWGLPPDWLSVSRPGLALAPAAAWPPRFSFDAIRVPLWLSWAGVMPPALGANFITYWHTAGTPCPAWVDLEDGTVADFAAPAGMTAVAALTEAALTGSPPQLPRVADATDYYSAALTLLSRIAALQL